MKDSEILNARFQKLQSDFESQLIACDMLNSDNQNKAADLKVGILQCIHHNWSTACMYIGLC